MQEIDVLTNRILAATEAMKRARAEALAEAGDELLAGVKSRIGGTGKMQSVQGTYIGSGRGYIAVRAMADTDVLSGNQRYAAGYITNALENGHAIRTPSRNAKRYRNRRHTAAVSGKHMYRETEESDAERVAADAAKKIEDAAMCALNGG